MAKSCDSKWFCIAEVVTTGSSSGTRASTAFFPLEFFFFFLLVFVISSNDSGTQREEGVGIGSLTSFVILISGAAAVGSVVSNVFVDFDWTVFVVVELAMGCVFREESVVSREALVSLVESKCVGATVAGVEAGATAVEVELAFLLPPLEAFLDPPERWFVI